MTPGEACIACHLRRGAVGSIRVAGTVYPSAHEPDDCHGASQATVELYDLAGQLSLRMSSNAAGNFQANASPPASYTARVTLGGRVATTQGPHSGGDCNVCHTQGGASGARGRIIVP
ncbi:MAG: carboxypeptidase-like regulatory domain-containing protein [Myxococcota bacterium]